MAAQRVCAQPAHKRDAPRVTTTKRRFCKHTVSRRPNSHFCNKCMPLCSGMGGSTFAPSNNNFFLETIRFNNNNIIKGPFRFLLYAV